MAYENSQSVSRHRRILEHPDLTILAAYMAEQRWLRANPFRRRGTPKKIRRGKDRSLGPAQGFETVTVRMMFRANRKGWNPSP